MRLETLRLYFPLKEREREGEEEREREGGREMLLVRGKSGIRHSETRPVYQI